MRIAPVVVLLLLTSGLGLSVPARSQIAGETAAEEAEGLALESHPFGIRPRIVNGVKTTGFPSVVALLDENDGSFCTGTMVGCGTVLTAAHCVCDGDGGDCQANGPELIPASAISVFLPNAGFFDVAKIDVPPDYEFGVRADVAILELAVAEIGVGATPINTVARPATGTPGTIVGFGLTSGNSNDSGLKRAGLVSTTTCTAVSNSQHVCWEFTEPLGAPGDDSNTCSGDSGGPLFVNFGPDTVVAGVTSGGVNVDCQTPDSSFDTDIYRNRAWIENTAGVDLDNTTCGEIPQVGTAGAPILSGEGELDAMTDSSLFEFALSEEVEQLRVGLNGEDGSFFDPNDFDLFVNHGSPPNGGGVDCASERVGTYEYCEIADPAAGDWFLEVQRVSGSGGFQISAVLIGSGECFPSSTTLCISDEPGDRRFEVTVDYSTVLGGGSSGQAQAIPLDSLGVTRGGLFWFFSKKIPEMLIKVVKGCGNNGHYWVFYAATTNAGFVTRVRDTQTGQLWTSENPDENPAPPVQDTLAFLCASDP